MKAMVASNAMAALACAATVAAAQVPQGPSEADAPIQRAAHSGVADAAAAESPGLTFELTRQQTTLPLIGRSAAGPDLAAQTMLWAGRGAFAVGLGVEQRWRRPLNGADGEALPGEGDLMLGLAVSPTNRTRFSLQWPSPPEAPRTAGSLIAPSARQVRLALTFKRSDPYATLRSGALTKLEISSQTALALRARGGRVGVALTSRW